jgi:hypothetical protein
MLYIRCDHIYLRNFKLLILAALHDQCSKHSGFIDKILLIMHIQNFMKIRLIEFEIELEYQ